MIIMRDHRRSACTRSTIWLIQWLQLSIHIKIGFPAMIDVADIIADEEQIIWALRFFGQSHPGLFGRPIAFFIVTFNTGTNQIFPTIFAAPDLWNDMIDGHRPGSRPTILALMVIPFDYVLPRQDDPFPRHIDEPGQPNDAGQRITFSNRVNVSIILLDQLRLPEKDQNNGLLHIRDGHRLIILIQHQHM